MDELRLYTDEDSGRNALITGLHARGFDVLSTNDAGRSGEDDRSQLEFSTQQGRAIYTFNVGDFARLHVEFLATGQHH